MARILLIPVLLVALLLAAMLFTGGVSEPKADFSFINRGEVTSLDPNRMSWMQDIRIGYALWEGLYTADPVTLNAIPGSAFPIDVSADKTVYTFHIRPQAKWSNGDDLVADDFIFAWKRMLQLPGEYTYLLYYIKGAKAYQDAYVADFKTADFSKVSIEELNPKTLRVTLDHPVPPFPDIVAMPAFFPLNEKSMEPFLDQETLKRTNGRLRHYVEAFTLPGNLVTNGPYRLSRWDFKQRMRMVANDYYWDRAHVKSAIVDQVSAEDIQWAFTRYEDHGVDWIAAFTGEIAAELLKKHRADVHVFPAFGTYFYSINCQPKLSDGRDNPCADMRVRQAFAMAIDKRIIVETITRMGEIPTEQYIPVGAFAHYVSPPGLPMNVARARELLAEAGYPGGKGFPPISILFNNEAEHGPIAENVHRQWLENLGIDVKLEGIEVNLFRERLHNKDYTIARAGWGGDYNDPSTFTDKYKPDSENNDSGWKNDAYADLCKHADVEPDPAKRLHYFEQAENLMLNEAPIIPIYTYVCCYLFRDNVKGIPLNSRQMLMMKSAEVTR